MTTPLFTVVIPTFNRPEKLAKCLGSLAEQTLPPSKFDVIIIDDSGRQGEVDDRVLRDRGISSKICRQHHSGPAAARNLGASAARGRYLAFTDDDCCPAPDWLETLLGRFETTGDASLIGGRVVNALSDDLYAAASQLLVDYMYAYFNVDADRAMLLTSNNFCVPRALFLDVGGFDTAFSDAGGEDRELCLRLARAGRRLVYATEAVVFHFHDMTLQSFFCQHLAYGRGSAVLRARSRACGYGPIPLEPASFYVELLRYPLKQRTGAGRSLCLSALFALSQAANTIGYAHACLKTGMRS